MSGILTACCCGQSTGVPCGSLCSGTAFAQIGITISGLILCPLQTQNTGSLQFPNCTTTREGIYVPNGTFILPQQCNGTSACCWGALVGPDLEPQPSTNSVCAYLPNCQNTASGPQAGMVEVRYGTVPGGVGFRIIAMGAMRVERINCGPNAINETLSRTAISDVATNSITSTFCEGVPRTYFGNNGVGCPGSAANGNVSISVFPV